MSTILAAIAPVWKVLLVGLLLGAGLPAIFSLGVRALAGAGGEDTEAHRPGVPARLAAGVCFLVVLLAVLAGLLLLTASEAFLERLGLA